MSCIKFSRGYKYQTRATHVERTRITPKATITTDWLSLDPDGNLTIACGYAWDGASGPTWDGKSSMRGSLSHDGFYQLIRLGLLSRWWKPMIDSEFRRICIEDGMFQWRANAWYWAVRKFASGAAKPWSEPKDECAPCEC